VPKPIIAGKAFKEVPGKRTEEIFHFTVYPVAAF
jgi:hypothetical protein